MGPEDIQMSPELIDLAKTLGALILITGLALALRWVAFRALRRWATAKTDPTGDVLIQSLRTPSLIWCVLIGMYVAIDLAPLPERLGATALKVVYGLLVLSVTAALANVAGSTLRTALQKNNLIVPATGLSLAVARAAIWVIGALVLLSGLGVSITPILTALGVGGLAVALALQDTLSNLFAGIHILIDRPVRVGDFVRLESGQEGYIADIGWRTTRVRTLPNNLVIIPNNKLTQTVLTNYSLPERRMGISITVNVAYQNDPDRVARVLTDEAMKAVGQVPGLLEEPAPAARLIPGFADNWMVFTLGVQVREFEDQYVVQDELRKRIMKRFEAEKIAIAIPPLTTQLRSDL